MGNSDIYVGSLLIPLQILVTGDCLGVGILFYFITVEDSLLTLLFEKLKPWESPH